MSAPEISDADVCVIVPTFNRANFLREAVDSLLAQTRRPAEIIVVDDGSTDATPAVVGSYGDRVRYIRQDNRGKASAVNAGVRNARSEFIYVFDDDDIACPDAIEKLLAPLERNAELGFSHGGLVHFVADEQGRRREILRPAYTIAESGHHFAALQQRCAIAHNASLVRRRCYEEAGYLDESYKRSEDFEFLLRLTARFDGVSIPATVLNFRRHPGARGPASEQHDFSDRDRVHFRLEQKMFGALRGRVPIERYVGKWEGDPLTQEERFDAWLLRSISMSCHGLWPAFDEDILRCGEIRGQANLPLSPQRARLLSEGFSHWLGYLDESGKCTFPARSVSLTLRALGSDAARPIARGFYWAARGARSDEETRSAMKCGVFAIATIVRGWTANSQPLSS